VFYRSSLEAKSEIYNKMALGGALIGQSILKCSTPFHEFV